MWGGSSAIGLKSDIDRYSNYATQSIEAVIKNSTASDEQIRYALKIYAPEAARSYYVDIEFEDDD